MAPRQLKEGSFERGEILEVPDDTIVYEALISFWLAPFALLRPGDVFRWSPTTERVYYMPCGYAPNDDVEACMSKEDIQGDMAKGFFQLKQRTGPKVVPAETLAAEPLPGPSPS